MSQFSCAFKTLAPGQFPVHSGVLVVCFFVSFFAIVSNQFYSRFVFRIKASPVLRSPCRVLCPCASADAAREQQGPSRDPTPGGCLSPAGHLPPLWGSPCAYARVSVGKDAPICTALLPWSNPARRCCSCCRLLGVPAGSSSGSNPPVPTRSVPAIPLAAVSLPCSASSDLGGGHPQSGAVSFCHVPSGSH